MVGYMIATLAVSLFLAQQPDQVQTVGSERRTFTGVLVDAHNADCGVEVAKAVPKGGCPASFRSTNFGLILADGKQLKFDEAGNTKVVDALRRSRRGAKALFDYWRTGKANATIKATAVGTLTSDTLNLESIKVD